MDRASVTSSNLAEVGYDVDSETLEIMFWSGGVYQYFNIPYFLYERLIQADSPGKFFLAEIKGKYPEARL
jgi:KTSC domain